MSQHNGNREAALSRRHALGWITVTGTTALYALSAAAGKRFSLFDQAEAAAIGHDKPVIPVIVKDTTSFYWQTVIAGARKAGQDLGIKIVELGAQSDSDTGGQISILEIAVASNPTALVLAPAQFAALRRPIDEAAKKVKIIGIDSDADSAAFTSMVATDNAQAGRIAADIRADRIKRTYADAEGDVALITSSPGIVALDQRSKGFKEQIAAKYGAMELVAEKVAENHAAAREIMAELISAHSELRGVFASNPTMAHGAAEAMSESKTNKTGDTINLVGFDWDDQLVKFLQDGTIAALVVQDPFRMGYDGVKTALAASKGDQVAPHVDTGVSLITKANMNSARSHELLNPKIK
jgi:ribose transport system substrate-binding protein